MRSKKAALILATCLLGACATGRPDARARFYQDELDIMLMRGKDYQEVTQVLNTWEFGVLDTWEAINPDESSLKRLDNRKLGRFSEQEKRNIFKNTGSYNVFYLLKQESSESASLGEISGMGFNTRKDNTVDIERYSLIRTTFHNQKLIQFKVWTDITTSNVSGFKVKRVP